MKLHTVQKAPALEAAKLPVASKHRNRSNFPYLKCGRDACEPVATSRRSARNCREIDEKEECEGIRHPDDRSDASPRGGFNSRENHQFDKSSSQLGDAYWSLQRLTAYAGLSVRTLRSYLNHPVTPLPHYRIGGKILVKRSDYDAWARRFQQLSVPSLGSMVDDVMESLH